MLVSGHKCIQLLAVYQKTKEKQKMKMGKTLFQLMTREEDDIDVNQIKEIASAPPINALPAPPVMVTPSKNALVLIQLVPILEETKKCHHCYYTI